MADIDEKAIVARANVMTPTYDDRAMRTIILFLVAVFTAPVLVVPGCSQTGNESENDSSSAAVNLAGAAELNYTITGMHCDACAEAITSKVKQISGVAWCEASFKNRSLVVKTADLATDEAVRAAVIGLGYGIEPALANPPVEPSASADAPAESAS
jgi:copper chaperone CopZ